MSLQGLRAGVKQFWSDPLFWSHLNDVGRIWLSLLMAGFWAWFLSFAIGQIFFVNWGWIDYAVFFAIPLSFAFTWHFASFHLFDALTAPNRWWDQHDLSLGYFGLWYYKYYYGVIRRFPNLLRGIGEL